MIKFVNTGISPQQASYLTGDVYQVRFEECIGSFKRDKYGGVYSFVQGCYGAPMTADDLRIIADKLDELNERGALLGKEGGEK